MTEAAQLLGCKVYRILRDFERYGTAENALWHIPNYPKTTAGICIKYIPEFERYKAICHVALAKMIKLLNSPLEHQTALEFDLFYPHLKGLTPDSLVITSTNESIEAGELLGFTVFVKGAIQSRKMQGWESCVANNHEELVRLTFRTNSNFLLYLANSSNQLHWRNLVILHPSFLTELGTTLAIEIVTEN